MNSIEDKAERLYRRIFRLDRKTCPGCHQPHLTYINTVRATIAIDGKRAPASWKYYECAACGEKWKIHLHGVFETPTESEIAMHWEK